MAEKVYNKRETEDQKEERREREHREREKRDKRQERSLTKILDRQQAQMEKVLLAAEAGGQEGGQRFRPKLGKNQCRYCKEEEHWARERPKIRNKGEASTGLGKKVNAHPCCLGRRQ